MEEIKLFLLEYLNSQLQSEELSVADKGELARLLAYIQIHL